MMPDLTYTSRQQVEVYHFSWPVSLGVPLAALLLQAMLPARVHFFDVFDLPLLVTIFFAISRRNPIAGMATGAALGLAQDALSGGLIGVTGIAKTAVGYAASSLGVRIDVENPGTRFLMVYGFYLLHGAIYVVILRWLADQAVPYRFLHELGAALANALLGVVVFAVLDRLRRSD